MTGKCSPLPLDCEGYCSLRQRWDLAVKCPVCFTDIWNDVMAAWVYFRFLIILLILYFYQINAALANMRLILKNIKNTNPKCMNSSVCIYCLLCINYAVKWEIFCWRLMRPKIQIIPHYQTTALGLPHIVKPWIMHRLTFFGCAHIATS